MPSKATGKLTDEIGFSLPSFTGGTGSRTLRADCLFPLSCVMSWLRNRQYAVLPICEKVAKERQKNGKKTEKYV